MQNQIYARAEEKLGDLLMRAGGSNEGATLLIPDLQRPYRWKPNQIVALLDSLLRGWPFGTLLVWDIGMVKEMGGAEIIPSRPFWSHVDRTTGAAGKTYAPAAVPASFLMVLDGQQRLQSLLLATWGADSGFKLRDGEWLADLHPGERQRSTDHWAWGQLCIDVESFATAYEAAEGDSMRIDYQGGVLIWAVCNAQSGVSPGRTKQQVVPIPPITRARHVRFSRVWNLAPSGPPTLPILQKALAGLLDEHGFQGTLRERASNALLALTLWLGELKKTDITFLKVNPPPTDEAERERYDEAVVNIFTRLNSAGTPLSPQEILFAWIKRKWRRDATEGREADECFERLRVELEAAGLSVDMDDLVRCVSAFWSVCANGGVILGDAEFRRGRRMSEMAPWLAERWGRVRGAMLDAAHAVDAKGLEQNRHYESVNSVFVLAAWLFLMREWVGSVAMGFLEKEAATRDIDASLNAAAAQWMLVPQWAGVWQRAVSFSEFVGDLGSLRATTFSNPAFAEVFPQFSAIMERWVSDRQQAALTFIQTVHAELRSTVRRYYSLLWAWQLLDTERARLSAIALHVKSRASPSVHVDHVVSYDYWSKQIAPLLGPDVDMDGLEDGPNALGNCILLHANFNISKQEKPVIELLAQVHEFKKDPALTERWASALALDDVQMDARDATPSEVRAAIAARGKLIREDLARFVRREVGLASPPETVTAEAPLESAWAGEWDTEHAKGGAAYEPLAVKLIASGDAILGEYEGGTLEARVVRSVLVGRWNDGKYSGGFRWLLDDKGATFEGTWGKKSHRRGAGTWRGRRRPA